MPGFPDLSRPVDGGSPHESQLAAGLAELDARLAHARWLYAIACECNFADLVDLLDADIREIEGWRAAIETLHRGKQ